MLTALTLTPALALAEPTLELRVSGPSEIFSGDPESVSLDPRGLVSAGRVVSPLGAGIEAPITCLASTEKGLFVGTSGGGLLRLDANGNPKKVLDADKLVISAVAPMKGGVLAATSPDGNLSLVDAEGKKTAYADPTEKYVWALLVEGDTVLAATGEPGHVLELGAGGKSKILFDPGETHVRTLIRHPTRGLIAGGGQKGIVYQLKPGGGAFALYDSGMDEVTAFAVDPKSGDLYAALVSETKPGAVLADKTIGAVANDPSDTSAPIKGSEVVRIKASGGVETIWSSRREAALALIYEEGGRQLIIATGAGQKSRGRVYAVDVADRDRLRLIARVEPRIVSAMAKDGNSLILGTAPLGRVLRLLPGLRTESVYVSSEQDLQGVAEIGRIWSLGDNPPGSKVEVFVRTGNTKSHDDTWSSWSQAVVSQEGGAVKVPEGRFLQLRAVLHTGDQGRSPLLRSLHASLQRRNLAPTVEEIFLLRPGVYLRPMPPEEEKEKTVTVSQSSIQRLRRSGNDEEPEVRARQGQIPGMLTVAWRASDPNKDDLLYRVELRRLDPEGPWMPLSDAVEHAFFTFDGRSFSDGRYQFRITASDRPSNGPEDALSDQNVSEAQIIDNTPPKITNLAATAQNGGLKISAEAEDQISALGEARFSLDGGPWLTIPAADRLTDAKKERFETTVRPDGAPGEPKLSKGTHSIAVKVDDERGNLATSAASFVIP
ncbi:MAG: hypothetical protein U1E65_14725 [Myxococcota bacterium]